MPVYQGNDILSTVVKGGKKWVKVVNLENTSLHYYKTLTFP